MPLRPRVYIDVKEHGRMVWVGGDDPRLLGGLTHRSVPGSFAVIDVSSRLQPQAEPLMPVKEGATWPAHDGRSGDVDGTGMLIERAVEAVQLNQESAL